MSGRREELYAVRHSEPLPARLGRLADALTGEYPPHDIADLREAAQRLRVKQLDWAQHPGGGQIFRAITPFGTYVAISSKRIGWMFSGHNGEDAEADTATIEDAKNGAQADFESRVLANFHSGRQADQ